MYIVYCIFMYIVYSCILYIHVYFRLGRKKEDQVEKENKEIKKLNETESHKK